MVNHIIIWKLKDDIDKEKVAQGIKENLESLNGKMEGMVMLEIHIQHLSSSSGDVMLVSTFESNEALQAYAKSPLHNQIADEFVRPYTSIRLSYDYVIE